MNIELLNNAIDFYKEGNSMAATAKVFHSTPGTLKRLFRDRGIHIRGKQEQLILENKKRATPINHSFFSCPTDMSMYYTGFIAADGTIRKDRNEIKIALSAVDKLFLETMRQNLQYQGQVHDYMTNNGFSCVELRFTSLQIKQDLQKYGVVPNKTYKGLTLQVIPKQFQLAFIKGFFDGDGSFVYNKNTKQAKVTFTSHLPGILKEIGNYFNGGYIYQDKRTLAYSLEFSTIPSLSIMQAFYRLETPCLERKKQKYLEYLVLRDKTHEIGTPQTEDEKIC